MLYSDDMWQELIEANARGEIPEMDGLGLLLDVRIFIKFSLGLRNQIILFMAIRQLNSTLKAFYLQNYY